MMRINVVRLKILWIALAAMLLAVRSYAAEWKKFTSERGDFIVLMPNAPREREGTAKAKGDTREFTAVQGGVAYTVIYVDFDGSIAWLSPEQALDNFVTGGIKADKKNKVLGERPITLEEYKGRAVKYKSTDGYVARAKIYFVKRRLYQVSVAAGTEKLVDSKDAETFLNSFELIGKYEPTVETIAWKPFAAAKTGFSILMPGTPQAEKDPPLKTAFGEVTGFSYMTMSSSGLFGVSYSDYPATVMQTEPKKVLDGERDRILKNTQVKLLNEKEITLGEYAGKEMTLELPQGMVSQSRLYLVKQRLYQVSALVPGAKKDAPETQKDINQYFDSFQLVPAE